MPLSRLMLVDPKTNEPGRFRTEIRGGKRVLTGSTSEIHPEIPVENAMTMYDVFRNYGVPEFAASHRK